MGCAPSHNNAGDDDDSGGPRKGGNTRQKRLSVATGKDVGGVPKVTDTRQRRLSTAMPGGEAASTSPTHRDTVTAGQFGANEGSNKGAAAYAFAGSVLSKAGQEPGYKKTNQDNCFLHKNFMTVRQSLFGCFDGHGPNGHHVSAFVKEKLPATLATNQQVWSDPGGALKATFMAVDAALCACGTDISFSGSTGVVTLLQGKRLTCAWVGDSRCVLGRRVNGSLCALALTEDHKPGSDGERTRILASGGRVDRLINEAGEPVGPQRVWLRSAWIPGLAMSRALGDAVAHQVGVISEPEVLQHDLTPDDEFMVIATDGVWEFISNEEAVAIVAGCSSPEAAAKKLVEEAHRRWVSEEDGVVDDITVVVAWWKHP